MAPVLRSPVTVIDDVEEYDREGMEAQRRGERLADWLVWGRGKAADLAHLASWNKNSLSVALAQMSVYRSIPAIEGVRESVIASTRELRAALEKFNAGAISSSDPTSPDALTLGLFKSVVHELEMYCQEILSQHETVSDTSPEA